MKSPSSFYRYKIVFYGERNEPKIELDKWKLFKETRAGFWIVPEILPLERWKKWIPKKSKKRFAYPTKEEAFTNLKARTYRRAGILEWQLEGVEKAILKIEQHPLNG